MTQRYGIDTSVLVWLITGAPPDAYLHCVNRLSALVAGGAEIFASKKDVGEAFVAVRHHYSVAAVYARTELSEALRSGLVAPMNGRAVIEALEASSGPGLFDRLNADDYTRRGLAILTLDRMMAGLSDFRPL